MLIEFTHSKDAKPVHAKALKLNDTQYLHKDQMTDLDPLRTT